MATGCTYRTDILGKFNLEVQPLSSELNRLAGVAKPKHFPGLVLIFCLQFARYAAV